MESSLYINKTELFLKKRNFEKAVESMNKVIELNDDEVSVTRAHCFLGEYYFVKGNYDLSKENLEWISENSEELENEYDDLLNDEICTADVLLSIMDRFVE